MDLYWIKKEQKGFTKGRFIFGAIISLWEGTEHADEAKQDYIFFKIDFEKTYGSLSWKHILEALKHMGCGIELCHMVKTILGNTIARINVNGQFT